MPSFSPMISESLLVTFFVERLFLAELPISGVFRFEAAPHGVFAEQPHEKAGGCENKIISQQEHQVGVDPAYAFRDGHPEFVNGEHERRNDESGYEEESRQAAEYVG